MRKLSMFQIILLVVFGALAISGILIFALAVGGGGGNAVGPITIWGTFDQNAFTSVLRQAAENNAALSQVTYVQKDATTYESDLTNALASGTGPDLFLLSQNYAMKDSGKVAVIPYSALSESQFQNTFIQAASPFAAPNGVLGIPILADPLVLYWNKDMLASAGYSEPPAYWDQLFGMAQKITTKNDAGSIVKAAIAFGEYQNVDNAKDILALLILQAGGSITALDSTSRLTAALVPKTAGAAQSTESALRFYTEFADPSKNDYSWNRSLPAAHQAFSSGNLALYFDYASQVQQVARANPNLNFGVASTTQIRGASRSLDVARVYALAAARAGKNSSAALTVAYLLASNTNSKALSVALGIPSARRDVLSQPMQDEGELFRKMAIIGYSWIDPDPNGTADIFRGMIEDTTSGAQLPTQAVSRADQELSQLMGL